MKLYIVHTGFYDKNIDDGFYEQHSNIILVASCAYDAKEMVKQNPDFIAKNMHIDGIKEIEVLDGYKLVMEPTNDSDKINNYNHTQVRFLKSN